MSIRSLLMSLAVVLMTSAEALAATPTDTSIETLLKLTKAEATIESLYSSFEKQLRQNLQVTAQNQSLSPEQKQSLSQASAQAIALMREMFNWQKMQPQYVQIYRETFDQEEINGLIEFYNSKAGQALTNKMPIVLKKSLVISQDQMKEFMPKVLALIEESMNKLQPPK